MRTPRRTLVATLLVVALAVSLTPTGGAGAADEIIGVSGHWVIEVRDPDGTLATRREFHNTLHPSNNIREILTSQRSAGALEVTLDCSSVGCPRPCPTGLCRIVEPRQTFTASASLFKNLTVVNVAGGFQLRGFIVAGADATIDQVFTFVTNCAPTVASSSCVASTSGAQRNGLTTAVISGGIPVVNGQQVLVTVTIGFATGAPSPPATSPSATPAR